MNQINVVEAIIHKSIVFYVTVLSAFNFFIFFEKQ